MDQQQIEGPDHDVRDATATEEPPGGAQVWKAKVVRLGWVVCIVGLIITLMGTRQLAVGGRYSDGGARILHSLGLLVLLSGFVVALIGYRLPWLMALARSVRPAGTGRSRTGGDVPGSGSTFAPSRLAANCLVAALLAGAILSVAVVFLWFLPAGLSGLLVTGWTLALTAAALVVVIGGTRLQRAFCIGALLPLGMATLSIWFYVAGSLLRGYGVTSTSELGARLKLLAYTFEGIGSWLGTPALFTWIAALVLGGFTLVVQILLDRWNTER